MWVFFTCQVGIWSVSLCALGRKTGGIKPSEEGENWQQTHLNSNTVPTEPE